MSDPLMDKVFVMKTHIGRGEMPHTIVTIKGAKGKIPLTSHEIMRSRFRIHRIWHYKNMKSKTFSVVFFYNIQDARR